VGRPRVWGFLAEGRGCGVAGVRRMWVLVEMAG
jgi:hypothetical protein